MRVVVTGGAGFVGARIVRALIERGDEVLLLLRASTNPARVRNRGERLRITTLQLDDDRAVRDCLSSFKADAVIHAAWYADASDYLDSVENLDSLATTTRFARSVIDSGCPRLVGIGTCLEYATSDVARSEADRCEPVSLYASCKFAAWNVMRALCLHSPTTLAWARLFHVYGPGEDPRRMVPSVAKALLAGKALDLSPGLQVRDPIHVDDVACAVALLASSPLEGLFNVSCGQPVSLRDMLLKLSEIVGRVDLLRFAAQPYRADEVMYLVGDSQRIRAQGWTPRFSLYQGLVDVVDTLATA